MTTLSAGSRTECPARRNPEHIGYYSPFPSVPRMLVTTSLLPVSTGLPMADILHTQSLTLCGLLCVAAVIGNNVFEVPLCCSMLQLLIPFSWLNNIPLCTWTTRCLPILVWATAHSVVMNVHGQSLFEYWLPVGRCILDKDVRASVLDLRKLCANMTE